MNPLFRHLRALPFGLLLLFLCAFWPDFCPAQEPAAPPTAPPPPAQSQTDAAKESSNKQPSRIPPFLILGTVFNESGYAFPGVKIQIRRKGEKKFRYETYTNYRGEFAIHVGEGIEYEVVVNQKKYAQQSQMVSAKVEDVQQRLSFKLEPAASAKSGASK